VTAGLPVVLVSVAGRAPGRTDNSGTGGGEATDEPSGCRWDEGFVKNRPERGVPEALWCDRAGNSVHLPASPAWPFRANFPRQRQVWPFGRRAPRASPSKSPHPIGHESGQGQPITRAGQRSRPKTDVIRNSTKQAEQHFPLVSNQWLAPAIAQLSSVHRALSPQGPPT